MSHGKFLNDALSDDDSAIDVSELPSEYRVKVCFLISPLFSLFSIRFFHSSFMLVTCFVTPFFFPQLVCVCFAMNL